MNIQNKTLVSHILDAVNEIARYASERHDRKTELAIARLLEIMGREAIHLTPAFREKHGHIPWQKVISMQHLDTDSAALWKIVREDIPNLQNKIGEILKLEGV